ncbi:hypothetical protein KM043_013890 [Ampulex compressa]|nr:hypothetical protein KM043_013890 [Ampulex compressa]
MLIDKRSREEVKDIRVEAKVDSDHIPLTVVLRGRGGKGVGGGGGKRKKERRAEFKKRMGKEDWEINEGGIGSEEVERRMNEAIMLIGKKRRAERRKHAKGGW